MLGSFIAQWKEVPIMWGFLLAYLIHIGIYLVVAGGVCLLYGGLRRYLKIGELVDSRPLKPYQIRREISWGLGTCGVHAAFTLACLKFSNGIWPGSWPAGLFQIAAFFVFYDFCTYFSHRLLHTRRFIALHGVHHRSIRVTPWSVHCLHPVEALINQLPFLLFMLVLPLSGGMIVLLQTLLVLGSASGHSNYDPLARLAGLAAIKRYNRFHQRHHEFGRDNFGYAGTHWDVVFGTAYQPKLGKIRAERGLS